MKKKILKEIDDRIFRKEDIINISNKIYMSYSKAKSDHKNLSIKMNCENNETLEFENVDLRKYHNTLDIKKIFHLSFYFKDYRNNKRIEINISEGDNSWNNNLIIESDNISWVDSTDKSFEELFNSIQPQNKWFRKYRRLIHHLLSLNFGYFLIYLIKSFTDLLIKIGYKAESTADSKSNPITFTLNFLFDMLPITKYVFIIILSWLMGLILLIFFWERIENFLLSLWPSIEFDFGPEYKKSQKKTRKAIWLICSLFLVPIFLQILFSIF